MINELNLLEWTLNLSSNKKIKPRNEFFEAINKMVEKPDIIFLMETVRGNKFSIENYTQIIESGNDVGNTTTIAIRTELIENEDIKIINVISKIPYVDFANAPNFSQVDIKIGDVIYNLIAVRIKINSKDTIDEYRRRGKQFEVFVNYVSTLENPIIMGDFNHGRILGELDEPVSEIKKNNLYNKSQVIANYFYQKIRENFEENSLKLCTPNSSVSCGVLDKNKKVVEERRDWNYRIDHLVINEKYSSLKKICYNWDFLKKALDEGKPIVKQKNGKNYIIKGFPDHAMFIAKIGINGCICD